MTSKGDILRLDLIDLVALHGLSACLQEILSWARVDGANVEFTMPGPGFGLLPLAAVAESTTPIVPLGSSALDWNQITRSILDKCNQFDEDLGELKGADGSCICDVKPEVVKELLLVEQEPGVLRTQISASSLRIIAAACEWHRCARRAP